MFTLIILILVAGALFFVITGLRGKLSGWKTRILGYLGAVTTGLTSVLQEFQDYDWTRIISQEHAPMIAFGVFTAFIVLREITTGKAGNGDH